MYGKILAKYAAKSKNSKGRKFPEKFKDKRADFERDRDRIIHTEAFRRLEYKTQVFVFHAGDYYRTRLTHSLEVAQVSRGIARRLKVNEDLTEAIALAHDLGHTPFGHNGEYKLDKLMKDEGGFEHNLQSFRIVNFLEKRYPDFNGLNLTFETLEGLVKHSSKYDNPMNMHLNEFELDKSPTLEAQIIDIADEIAYNNHDIDDGLKSGLISFDDIYSSVSLWRESVKKVKRFYKNLDKKMLIYRAISFLISMLIDDVVKNSKNKIKENNIETLEDVRNFNEKLILFSKEVEEKNEELKHFLYNNLYTHNQVISMKIKADRVIETLFDAFMKYPNLLPKSTKQGIKKYGLKRVVADYIAGMTDRFALEEYNKIV
jgi:dGTPase